MISEKTRGTCRGINFGGRIVLSEQRYPDATHSFMSDVVKGWRKINKVDSSRISRENSKREVHSSMKSNRISRFLNCDISYKYHKNNSKSILKYLTTSKYLYTGI